MRSPVLGAVGSRSKRTILALWQFTFCEREDVNSTIQGRFQWYIIELNVQCSGGRKEERISDWGVGKTSLEGGLELCLTGHGGKSLDEAGREGK